MPISELLAAITVHASITQNKKLDVQKHFLRKSSTHNGGNHQEQPHDL